MFFQEIYKLYAEQYGEEKVHNNLSNKSGQMIVWLF
ncbi:hypothetical protein C8K15_10445 [Paenisporosarcina sp. OV554]|nr:hypothetical protein C8K15_10445 [Paenisporosarcina sp. OV554]